MRVASLIAGLLVASSAWADIGSVTEATGTAIIKRGRDTIQIVKGTEIKTNDKVETKNGKVKIVFKDDTNVTVTESSSLVIDDFVYDPKTGAGKLGLKAAAGTVRYVSGSIAKDPKNVKINTPTAAIAVRGTDFVMVVDEVGGSLITLLPSCDTSGVCYTGEITVETDAGIVITASHNPAEYNGYKIKANYGGPATPEEVSKVEALIEEVEIIPKHNFDWYLDNGIVSFLDMETMYANHARDNFDMNALEKMASSLVYDAMYGSGQRALERLLPNTQLLHCEHNPSFNGQAPEPIAKNLKPLENFIPSENIEKPMEGKRMGERLSWLNSQAQKLKEIVKKIKKLIYEHLKG